MQAAKGSRARWEQETAGFRQSKTLLMEIEFTPAAAKAMIKMPKAVAVALIQKIEIFAAAPFAPHGFAKRLKGSAHSRIRQGDWRAIVSIQSGRAVVLVLEVGHRREIYD